MHKSKKKSKTADKLPRPIKVKKEKTEEGSRSLYPISHYIDDRLDLVKQIFGTLKPKTITNLAPEFLKNKAMEDIEELCLNELLCMSKKRLLSIINATKCPTDTESSSDSDVQHKEEHVSLEEISSGSEIEGPSSSGAKRKSNKTGNGNVATNKNAKDSVKNEKSAGHVSVLELLELQARARAIRSQLAHEPVTKIEVDSDEEDSQDKRKSKKDSKDKRTEQASKRKLNGSNEPEIKSRNSAATKQITENGSKAAAETTKDVVEKSSSKKIKLKRNYRNKEMSPPEITSTGEEKKKKTDDEPSSSKDVKRERKSASPDVIPIIPEPETLLISDSSDKEDEDMQKKKKSEKVVFKKENNEQNVHTKAVELLNQTAENTKRRKSESTETEEGEISDNDTNKNIKDSERKVAANTNSANELESIKVEDKATEETSAVPQKCQRSEDFEMSNSSESGLSEAAAVVPADKDTNKSLKLPKTIAVEEIKKKIANDNTNKPEENEIKNTDTDDDDDQNDDVISIEGGDLETEMIEHLEVDNNTRSSFAVEKKVKKEQYQPEQQSKQKQHEQNDANIISLDSSEDEVEKNSSESWNARYLKSSKVNKVLATSRLGKRVRDNIKNSNEIKKEIIREAILKKNEKAAKHAFTSRHEDGSVEQYKELLEMCQRKT